MLGGMLTSIFGWRLMAGPDANPRSLRNFPMQANGADMLRLAVILATERGISVCATVHDAVLIEDDIHAIATTVQAMREAMREASELVLPGFPLRTEASIVPYPERYSDPRGEHMWRLVTDILEEVDRERTPEEVPF
jgi:hypothetical protein